MSINKLAVNGGHLFKLTPRGVEELFRDWSAGNEEWWINADRNADAICAQDPVFVWATGSADQSGIIALGLATGDVEDLEHPQNYHDPGGARVLRPSAQVFWWWVGESPVLTSAELKELPLFADFEVFEHPRKQNAFTVTPKQADYIIERVRAAAGEIDEP